MYLGCSGTALVRRNLTAQSVSGHFNALVLLTDAFGGHGGIAKFNRDLLNALCSIPGCGRITAVPRLMPGPPGPLPEKLAYVIKGLNSKTKYVAAVLESVLKNEKPGLIICGHINLLPIAFLVKKVTGSKLALVIHGIDAWQPPRSRFAKLLVSKVDSFISVSELTRERFLEWSGLRNAKFFILPNSVDIKLYGAGPKDPDLVARHGLEGKKVLMTMGRLASKERYKGFDEILELLPDLVKDIPEAVYLIAGHGDDIDRLKTKARQLEVEDKVIFAGMVPEDEKAVYFRLADVFVMPSRGEGFGIVFLEAMACGVPVVGSKADGSREALLNGGLGILVDPSIPQEIKKGIVQALRQTERKVPAGLEHFSFEKFKERVRQFIAACI